MNLSKSDEDLDVGEGGRGGGEGETWRWRREGIIRKDEIILGKRRRSGERRGYIFQSTRASNSHDTGSGNEAFH